MEKNYQQKLSLLRESALERLSRKSLLHPVLFLNMLRTSQEELENLKETSKAESLVVVELELVMELEMEMELEVVEDLEKEKEDQEDLLVE